MILSEKKNIGRLIFVLSSFMLGILVSSNLVARENQFQPKAPGYNPLAMPQKRDQNDDILSVPKPQCKPVEGKFVWNFQNEDLSKVLQQMCDMLCINVILSDDVKPNRKVSITGMTPMDKNQAWVILNQFMTAQGLSLIKVGNNKTSNTWTVLKKNDSINSISSFVTDTAKLGFDTGVSSLFYSPKHLSPDALVNVAKTILPTAQVATLVDQFVFITDSSSGLKKLGMIFERVDTNSAINQLHVIKLKHAIAEEVEKKIKALYGSSGPSRYGRRSGTSDADNINVNQIISDNTTNSLIFLSDQETMKKVRELVEIIDRHDPEGGSKGAIHVKKLKHGDAEKIADTLMDVVQESFRMRRPYGPPSANDSNKLFESDVKITAHKDTNTLVTVASPGDYKSLLRTIEELDVRREQVYIEAVVFSIKMTSQSSLGINLFSGLQTSIPGVPGQAIGIAGNPGGREIAREIPGNLAKGSALAGSTGLGGQSIGALAVLSNFLSGGVLGLVGPEVGGTGIPSFGAVLQAMASNSNVDVLLTPYLTASDNEEGFVSSGEKVPVIKGVSPVSTASQAGLSFPNIAYEDVKVSFKVTPHVGEDDNIRLDIEQEVSSLGAQIETYQGNKQNKIEQKEAKTTLVLKDQQTGVIGGLIGSTDRESISKVPFLGDIPLLGWLFKNKETIREKDNLVLVLTPYLLRNDADYDRLMKRKMKEREEFAKLYQGDKLKKYDKYVDYNKKKGPLTSLLATMEQKVEKLEKSQEGEGSQTILTPNGAGAKEETKPDIIFQEIQWEEIKKGDDTLPSKESSSVNSEDNESATVEEKALDKKSDEEEKVPSSIPPTKPKADVDSEVKNPQEKPSEDLNVAPNKNEPVSFQGFLKNGSSTLASQKSEASQNRDFSFFENSPGLIHSETKYTSALSVD